MTRRRLQGARVVVTGAEGAFGSATCDLLEAIGAVTFGIDLAHSASRPGATCDVTNRVAVDRAIAEAAELLGGIDVLVNVAGIGNGTPLSGPFDGEARAIFDVNAVGCWNVTSAALPWLVDGVADRGAGRVVNVASMLAMVTLPYVGAYAASKRAVAAISDGLRVGHPGLISAATVYPGYVATPIHDRAARSNGLSLAGRVPEESVAQVARTIVRAAAGRGRHYATSASGRVAFLLARHAPSLVERLVITAGRRRPIVVPDDWTVSPPPAPRRSIVP